MVSSLLDGQVTILLRSWSAGDRSAFDHLAPAVYAELNRIAKRHLQAHRHGTLQPTALVHEAYLRLCGSQSVSWQDRTHFFAVSAQLMRRILLDHFRARMAKKRGSGSSAITLDQSLAIGGSQPLDLLDIDTALHELADLDPRQARIVELRFFVGLSIEETAEALHISTATVKRDWTVAKIWIQRRLMKPEPCNTPGRL